MRKDLPPQACRTCRLRRVKCDKATPSCNRCVTTGRVCDGAHRAAIAANLSSKRRLLPAPPSGSALTLGGHRLSTFDFDTTDYEIQAFNHFRVNLVQEFTLVSPEPRWLQVGIQLSYSYRPLFQAAAAAGGANKAVVHVHDACLQRPRDATADGQAMHQYCRAIASLRQSMGTPSGRSSPAEALILVSLLFLGFEIYLANRQTLAGRHIDFGRTVLKDEMQKQGSRLPEKACQNLLTSFDRMHPERNWQIMSQQQPIPNIDVGIEDLILSADQLLSERLQAAEKHLNKMSVPNLGPGVHFCISRCLAKVLSHVPVGYQTQRLESLRAQHKERCKILLDPGARVRQAEASPQSWLLAIRLLVSDFRLSTCDQLNEAITDEFDDHFNRIIDLADLYAKSQSGSIVLPFYSEREAKTQAQSTFVPVHEILPALNLVFNKCRKPSIRRRAIETLYSIHMREGIYYSVHLADVGRWITAIEEKCAWGLGVEGGDIPAAARFSEVVIMPELYMIRLVAGRVVHKPRGTTLEVWEYAGGGDPMPVKPMKCRDFSFKSLGIA